MRHVASLALATVVAATLACGDSTQPTAPNDIAVATRVPSLPNQVGAGSRLVSMMDACDPTTFNAAIGPGTCARNGGVSFDEFVAQLTKHHMAGAWHFAPPTVNMRVGQQLVAVNRGGEVHTFTEVAHFGGGIVPFLNDLSGNPTPAPECLALTGSDFIPPGGTATNDEDDSGTELYQCCIHPWMRAVVHVRG